MEIMWLNQWKIDGGNIYFDVVEANVETRSQKLLRMLPSPDFYHLVSRTQVVLQRTYLSICPNWGGTET